MLLEVFVCARVRVCLLHRTPSCSCGTFVCQCVTLPLLQLRLTRLVVMPVQLCMQLAVAVC